MTPPYQQQGVRLLFVVNNPDFFISHRLPLGIEAREKGYDVHIAAPEGLGAQKLRAMEFPFHAITLSRSGTSPLAELRSIVALYRLYRQLRPHIVHHVTIKPVLYGTLAARLARIQAVVNAFSGLGFIFIQKGWKANLRRGLVTLAYRLLLRHPNQTAIFQNSDDQHMAVAKGWVRIDDTVLIRGSGVDLELFRGTPEPAKPLLVVLPARLLHDKGIREFAEAARLLAAGEGSSASARFALVGSPDIGNPASATPEWEAALAAEGIMETWGQRDDMHFVFSQAHIVCLPSYREGLPKALIEAAACGRAIVTTDVPGCREVIQNGEGGFLVPPQDAKALAAALKLVLENDALRKEMGLRNRLVAETHFGIEKITSQTLAVYKSLMP